MNKIDRRKTGVLLKFQCRLCFFWVNIFAQSTKNNKKSVKVVKESLDSQDSFAEESTEDSVIRERSQAIRDNRLMFFINHCQEAAFSVETFPV